MNEWQRFLFLKGELNKIDVYLLRCLYIKQNKARLFRDANSLLVLNLIYLTSECSERVTFGVEFSARPFIILYIDSLGERLTLNFILVKYL